VTATRLSRPAIYTAQAAALYVCGEPESVLSRTDVLSEAWGLSFCLCVQVMDACIFVAFIC
jgi:hypothetical protein